MLSLAFDACVCKSLPLDEGQLEVFSDLAMESAGEMAMGGGQSLHLSQSSQWICTIHLWISRRYGLC